MGVENRIENPGQEGFRSLGKMPEGPVRDTVWVLSFLTLRPPMAS